MKESFIDELENNQYFSKMIKSDLNLKSNPVAIKFILHKEDIPKNIDKIQEKIRHCEMVQKAARGDVFYSTSEEQLCKGGFSAIGLEKIPDKIASGEFYHGLGRFKSLGAAKRTLDSIPKIDLDSYAIIYSPLTKADFLPDVVVIITNPVQAMKVSQALVYTVGGRVEADFSGIQSVCADAVASPFINKRPNITFGCSGSRKFADIKDDEVIIGLNGENLGCTVNALNNI
ncbi:hypothetical protein ALNOE001_19010 [Candidatus Methanobinarius endosymbioticus]|uniref:ArCR n=1 Tax=Candidatus Methanobinarius endosymbioticus TaxID=2006182 RepID=A0A366M9X2_9EURY|nr:hypothetical protein ALNOE001_19010 [Candidatus Methanobinarius endosymbioticus]